MESMLPESHRVTQDVYKSPYVKDRNSNYPSHRLHSSAAITHFSTAYSLFTMSKFAILSALVVLSAHLSGGLASPAMMKRQEQGIPRPVEAAPTQNVEARQLVPGIISGVTSLIGGILADESASASVPAATASAVAEDLEARAGVAISVGGDIAINGHFTVDTEAASKVVEAQVAAVTSVVRGVTSVVGGAVGGVTSIIGGILADETASAPAATASAVAEDLGALQDIDIQDIVISIVGQVPSIIGGILAAETAAPVPSVTASVVEDLEARDGVAISVGGDVNFGGLFTVETNAASKVVEAQEAAITSVVGGVTSVVGGAVGGVTSVLGGVTSIIGGILADESASAPAATASAVAEDLEARDRVVISVGGDINFGGHFTESSAPLASKAIEAQVAAVTSVIGGVTSVVGGVTSVVGGVTTIIGGVTSAVGKAAPTPSIQQ
ncbi:hypothetical protein DFS33DRAFT_349292 [Desarmillaria ectypa]|nr:hypothetical protein DFS33DRAFT_349292 [Desarmillaria ectypa]